MRIILGLLLALCGFSESTAKTFHASVPWMQCAEIEPNGKLRNTDLFMIETGRFLRPKSDFRLGYTLKSDVRHFWHLFAKTMERRGVDFSFMPIPPRGLRLGFAEVAPSTFSVKASLSSWNRFMRHWQLLNVDVIDLLPIFRPLGLQTAFLRDHHWSNDAAQAAALHLAALLKQDEVLKNLPKETYALIAEEQEYIGSYAKQYRKTCGKSPPAENITYWNAEWQSDDLFGEAPESLISVTGASNLKPEYGFAAHLTHAMSMPVRNESISGGGFHQGILSVLTRDIEDPMPYRLIWVLPGYQTEIYKLRPMHREVLAAAQGQCHAGNALEQSESQLKKKSFVHNFARPESKNTVLYMQLSIPEDNLGRLAFSDKKSVQVDIRSDDGHHWQHKFLRKRSGVTTFSLPLPNAINWSSNLQIEFNIRSKATTTAYICDSPYIPKWPLGIAFDSKNQVTSFAKE